MTDEDPCSEAENEKRGDGAAAPPDPVNVSDLSLERVEGVRSKLKQQFGEFDVIDQHWSVSRDVYLDYIDKISRGTLGGAGAWVLDDNGRVLLVQETDRNAWSEPSGHHEPGETLCETAHREVYEETGIQIELTGVGLFQHLHVTDESGDLPTLHRVIVVFLACQVSGEMRACPNEIDRIDWFEDHPESFLYEELRRLDIPYSGD